MDKGKEEILSSIDHDDLALFKNLISNMDVNMTDDDGRSLLHHAISNSKDITFELLNQRVNLYHKDDAGWTCLHLAASNGQFAIVELLLDHDSSMKLVDLQTNNGQTALHFSCSKNHVEIARKILSFTSTKYKNENGNNELIMSSVFKTDSQGQTCLHRACSLGHVEIVNLILSFIKEKIDAQNDSIHNKEISLFKYFVNLKDSNGKAAIDLALEENRQDVVNVLIEKYKAESNISLK